VLSDFLYVFATKYLAILFWLLNLIADCVLKKILSVITKVLFSACITMLLLETVSDIMPKKTLVTKDSSTPDIQSEF